MKLFRFWKDKFQNSSFYHWLKVDEVYLEPFNNYPELLAKQRKLAVGRWMGTWCAVGSILCFFASSFLQFFRMFALAQENPFFFVLNAMILVAALCFAIGNAFAYRCAATPILMSGIAMVAMALVLFLPFDLQIRLQLWQGNNMYGFVFIGAAVGALAAMTIIWILYKDTLWEEKTDNDETEKA